MIWDEPVQQVVFHQPLNSELVLELIASARRAHPGLLVICEIVTDGTPTFRRRPTPPKRAGSSVRM